jgi:hypothetical protein
MVLVRNTAAKKGEMGGLSALQESEVAYYSKHKTGRARNQMIIAKVQAT